MSKMAERKPLREMAQAFEKLANAITSQNYDGKEAVIDLGEFSSTCTFVYPLFQCLGVVFKFAEMDYVEKVDCLVAASKSISTLQLVFKADMEANCVRKINSNTRNLLRVKRGVDMVKVLIEEIGASNDSSLMEPASKAYTDVFAPYHSWAIRKAVDAGMYFLPTKAQLFKSLNEDENSAKVYMQSFVASAVVIVEYVDQLFLSRDLGNDW